MPLFSRFAPFGLFAFSSREPGAKAIYRALATAQGAGLTSTSSSPGIDEAFSAPEGSHVEATLYARAMAIAGVRATLQRASLNLNPATATEKLAQHEAAFQVAPGATATIAERRAVLAAKNLASRGSRPEAIDNALRALLGTDFVDLYVIPRASAEKWPSTYGATPGLFSRIDLPAKTVRMLDPVAPNFGGFGVTGAVVVPYENWDTSRTEETLAVGDRIVVEPEIPGGAELVTVTASSGTGASRTFTATFAKCHEQGCSATTRPTPFGLSTRRHMLVILKTAAAKDPEKRRLTNDLMRTLVRGVSTWAIVHESPDGSGAFVAYRLDTDSMDTCLLTSFTR